MEAVAHLDTHAVVWLYAGELERFPAAVRELLDSAELKISPAVTLELQYLFEIKRITQAAELVVADLSRRLGLQVDALPFEQVVSSAVGLSWTRDPFDRLIVAQASAQGALLVTADRVIRRHYRGARWGRAARAR